MLEINADSPFIVHTGSNFAPSLAEARAIRELLEEPLHTLECLDAQIANLQTSRRELAALVDGHLAFLSPIRRVNSDVLRIIFLFYCEAQEVSLQERLIPEPPLLLASVCHLWRITACTTPLLWSNIDVSVSGLPEDRTSVSMPSLERYYATIIGKEQRLKQWLERSGQVPLVLSIYVSPFPSIGSESYQWALFRFLQSSLVAHILPHSSRWYSLTLSAPSYLTPIFGGIQPEEIRLLHGLKLLTPRNEDSAFSGIQTNHPLGVLFESASLRTLTVRDHFHHSNVQIQWSLLTELELYPHFVPARGHATLSDIQALQILSLAASLRVCRVAFTLSARSGPLKECVFPKLQEITLIIDTEDGVLPPQGRARLNDVGRAIVSTPQLKSFSVRIGHRVHYVTFWPFPCLVSSECSLERLDLDLPISAPPVVNILRSLPNLTSLGLHFLPIPTLKAIVTALTPTGACAETICPRLAAVVVANWRGMDTEVEERLMTFAWTRCNIDGASGTTRLRKLSVRSTEPPKDSDILGCFLSLRNHGITIDWGYDRKAAKEFTYSTGARERDPFDTDLSTQYQIEV
ncbi:hypothetical protein VNI00_000701 [Paramarasmius palmivorus]|uniref:F-box domain-containing protein n=1 Tax=Paramarasmius palmivorus TaxID=297713 RepID=A0AAW0E5W7_9AGAR